jgi:hypothetical protein
MKLFATIAEEDGFVTEVKDFVSMYPATMVSCEYPLGHPDLEVHNNPVQWTSSTDNPYKGIIKAFVIPPANLRVPVLPMKLPNGRLAFSLCRSCSLDHPQGLNSTIYRCQHNDEERGWVCTTTHLELNVALARGYRVSYLARTLVWKRWATDLFSSYIK